MDSEPKARNRAEVVDEVSKWTVGLGIVAVALFPLSIPILVLTVAALVPLALPLLALGLLAIPFALARRLVASLRRRRARERRTSSKEAVSQAGSPAASTQSG